MVKKYNPIFKFNEELTEGIITKRKGQFIFYVKIKGKEYKCHCPTTGGVGGIIFKNIPCLCSKSTNKKRTTDYTVEAISLDNSNAKNKKWIGINQVASNKYIEFFLKNGCFDKMIKKINIIQREQKLGNSKMDFKINNNCYIEVKSPLQHLNTEIPDYIKTRKKVFLYDGNRLIKHCIELTKSLKKNERAIMLITFQYDSYKFDDKSKAPSKNSDKIEDAVYKFIEYGVEIWQVNLSIDSKGVKFLKSFPIDV